MNNIVNALGYGAMVAVVGLLIVFLGLTILIVCITVMAKIFDGVKARNAAKASAAAPAPAPAPVVETPAPAVEETTAVDDAELIAVIAAAIAAFDNSGKTLVVRKVRHVSAWNRSAREEQVCRF